MGSQGRRLGVQSSLWTRELSSRGKRKPEKETRKGRDRDLGPGAGCLTPWWPRREGKQLTMPGKRRLFMAWVASHNAQGTRVCSPHPAPGQSPHSGDSRGLREDQRRNRSGAFARGCLPWVGVVCRVRSPTGVPRNFEQSRRVWSDNLCFQVAFHLLLLLLHYRLQL